MCYQVNFGRSASKGVRINKKELQKLGSAGALIPVVGAKPGNTPASGMKEIHLKKYDPSRSAFQSHSRSLELTRIDRPPWLPTNDP